MARVAPATAVPLFLLLLWVGLVTWLTWPLASCLGTCLPADLPDLRYSAWALAWQSHALATDPRTLLDGNIYWPARHALLYGPTGMGALPLFAPVFLASGNPSLSANVTFLGGVALTAWTLSLVVRSWTGSTVAGVASGCAFLATPWTLRQWLPSTPHFAVLAAFPLVIFLAARPLRRRWDALVLVALIVQQSLVDVVYVAPALFAPLVALSVARLARPATRAQGARLAGVLAAALVCLLPLLAGHIALRRANPGLERQTFWGWGPEMRVTPLPEGLFDAVAMEPRLDLASPPLALPPIAFVLIGLGGASLLLHWWRGDSPMARQGWIHAAVWTTVGLAIALPPVIEWHGQRVALPHATVYQLIPALRVIRVPMRLGVAALMGACLLTGLAFAELAARGRVLTARWRTGPIVSALVALAVLTSLNFRFRFDHDAWSGTRLIPRGKGKPPVASPAPMTFLGALRDRRGPILEVDPGAWHVGGPVGARNSYLMFDSIGYWWPLLNGYSSYWPEEYFLWMFLATHLPLDRGALEALRRETGLELVIVKGLTLPPAVREQWEAAARSGAPGLELLAREGDDLLFRVTLEADAR